MSMIRLAVLAAAFLAALPAAAQVSTVDEGSFTIAQNGTRIGREDFRIRRTPTGDASVNFVASATVNLGDRQLAPDLRTDANGGLLAYRVEVRSGAAMQERLKGSVERGLFSAVLTTPRGEAAREYMVSDGAVILDDDVYHQYYFVAGGAARGPVLPVVVPRRNVQVTMRVESQGTEAVTVGGRSMAATHLVLTAPGGASRDVWADAQGRVLRVALPSRGIVAERDEAPR
jgi:hypothetical protein